MKAILVSNQRIGWSFHFISVGNSGNLVGHSAVYRPTNIELKEYHHFKEHGWSSLTLLKCLAV